jgi:hypothetical protein
MPTRACYSNHILGFLSDSVESILGFLTANYPHSTLEDLQINAWVEQVKILKNQLTELKDGQILFEYSIPRMGKRVDNILLIILPSIRSGSSIRLCLRLEKLS